MVPGDGYEDAVEDLIEIQSSHRARHRIGKLPNRIEQGTTLEVIIPPHFEPREVRYRASETCYS
jgi:hypothetical protein